MYQDIEDCKNYCMGGFYPIDIGDTIVDRYRVVNKLGSGASSTVWLAEDLKESRFVSLKVLKADVSASSPELHVSQHLKLQQERLQNHPGKDYVVQIYDTFTAQSPNGTHQYIVMEILGPAYREDLFCFSDEGRAVPTFRVSEDTGECIQVGQNYLAPDVAKIVAAQLALGVSFLHECGIVHGDLHLGNIAFYCHEFQHASLSQLTEVFGEPSIFPLKKGKAKVGPYPGGFTFGPLPLLPLLICLPSKEKIHIKICDFGESRLLFEAEPRPLGKLSSIHIPRSFAAPEVIFGEISLPTPAMDIWALGIIFHTILNCNIRPFECIFGTTDDLLKEAVLCLGKFPDKWWKRWNKRSKYFADDGKFIASASTMRGSGALGIVRWDSRYSKKDAAVFNPLLRKMLRYNYKARIGASDVAKTLASLWLNV